ncbi:MAG: glycosyl transferase family protein [Chitinophagaceae bacterium]|nr:glycosyl transferase family protein [Chitinophagaceae bacterium]
MYKKQLWRLIIISTVLRLLASALLELGNDEVYYYTYALHLQSNYFDHPPGVALLIRLFTFNLSFNHEVFVRLGSIICAVAGTLLTFKTGELIDSPKTGWYAAILYNTSIYTSVIAGVFILPDSPQVICWLVSLYGMLLIIKKVKSNLTIPFLAWAGLGIAIGLCIMCKVHGVFLWLGFGLYILLYERKLLLKPGLYIAAVITACIISPILFWNISNHFVTWSFHSNRVGSTHFDKDSFIQATLGQLFYNNPVNVILTALGTAIVAKRNGGNDFSRLLICCGLPIIITVIVMSAFNTVLPHWSGPGFLTLSFFAALYLNRRSADGERSIPLALKYASGFIVFLFTAGILFIHFYPGTIGSRDKNTYGENDFTLDMYGWKSFGKNFEQWFRLEQSLHHFKPGIKIIDNKWFPAAHIDYYVASNLNLALAGKGPMQDLHHYIWLNNYRPALALHDDALVIVPTNYPSDPAIAYKNSFNNIELLKTFTQYRNSRVCRYFNVYLLKDYNGR